MDPEFQCLVSFVLGGREGSDKNDHEFRLLGNIELYERPLSSGKEIIQGKSKSNLNIASLFV